MCTTRNVFGVIALAAAAFVIGRSNLLATPSALVQQQPAPPPARDNKPTAPKSPPPEADARMQALMKLGAPGEHHKVLEASVGRFEGTVRFRTGDGGDWVESKCTIEREWVLDKRYVREAVHAAGGEGGAFEGIGYLGYNNADGVYQVAWMDSQSTAITMEAGTYDADKKIMTMRAQERDPVSGRIMVTRSTWDVSNPDRQVYAGYTVGEDGKEFKSFEGVMERVKK